MAPLVMVCARHVNPFFVTWLSFLAGVASAIMCYLGMFPWALGLWILGRILDGLDGAIARAADTQSDFGGYLDMVLDTFVYTAVPLGIALGSMEPSALIACAVLLGAFYINLGSWMYLSALLEKRRASAEAATSIFMPTGFVEGSETVIFYILFLLFPEYAVVLFAAMAGLTIATAIQRLAAARRVLTSPTQS